jgi:hypothetical protein
MRKLWDLMLLYAAVASQVEFTEVDLGYFT